MAQNLVINSVTYSSVPQIQVPTSSGDTAVFVDTSDATATASQMLNGATGYVDGELVTGNISSLSATTYLPSTASQTINAAQYLAGTQTIEAVTVSNLTSANIASGVTVTVGCSSDADCVMSVTGTLSAATISQDSSTKILSIS